MSSGDSADSAAAQDSAEVFSPAETKLVGVRGDNRGRFTPRFTPSLAVFAYDLEGGVDEPAGIDGQVCGPGEC